MINKIFNSPFTRMILGIIVVGGCVVIVQVMFPSLLQKIIVNEEAVNGIVSLLVSGVALFSYIIFYKFYEKRQIIELSFESFFKYAATGFLTGLILQSLVILVIYIAGGYSVIHVNPVSFLLPSMTMALTAGFVVEIIIRGILFRLLEEVLGTGFALLIVVLIFVLMHLGSNGATIFSAISISVQGGFLLTAVYVYTRNLWFPIFLHFAWDLAEPGIFGALNPGISIGKSWLTSQLTGPELLTGGHMGPVNSIQSLLFCLLGGVLLLWLASRKGNFISPQWMKTDHKVQD